MKTIDELKQDFIAVGHYADSSVTQAVRAAMVLKRPLLVEGPAGVGKTALAQAMAKMLGKELLRVQCYEGIESEQVLYDFNYAKQLLMISMLKDKIHEKTSESDLKGAIDILDRDKSFWNESFLIRRPLLEAISAPKDHAGYVLLIDEVDKMERSTEALLLEVLSEYTVSIPEYGTIRSVNPPTVVLTGNRTRELSDALRRRCIYLYVDFPSTTVVNEILKLQVPDSSEVYRNRVITAINKIRAMPLKRIPSVSETLDMLRLLQINEGNSEGWMSVVSKHKEDHTTISKSNVQL